MLLSQLANVLACKANDKQPDHFVFIGAIAPRLHEASTAIAAA